MHINLLKQPCEDENLKDLKTEKTPINLKNSFYFEKHQMQL